MEKENKSKKTSKAAENKDSLQDEETMFTAAQEMEQLKTELEKANQQTAENFDGWQRERADFLNYKKRIERDQESTAQTIKGEVVKRFLITLDDLERALKTKPTTGEGVSWADGIELIYRKLQSLLDAAGVKRIEVEKQEFDPNLHEAITHEDCPDCESGQIIEVIEQGYTLGDRVIRPAKVRVAR